MSRSSVSPPRPGARTSLSIDACVSFGPCGPGQPRAAPEDAQLVGALQPQHLDLCRETRSDGRCLPRAWWLSRSRTLAARSEAPVCVLTSGPGRPPGTPTGSAWRRVSHVWGRLALSPFCPAVCAGQAGGDGLGVLPAEATRLLSAVCPRTSHSTPRGFCPLGPESIGRGLRGNIGWCPV